VLEDGREAPSKIFDPDEPWGWGFVATHPD
jgi:hypothetical protein